MGEIEVTGRGIHAPVIQVELFADRARLRIDDEKAPELWCEVTLPVRVLCDLLVGVLLERGATPNQIARLSGNLSVLLGE